jgi:hypothetical protein
MRFAHRLFGAWNIPYDSRTLTAPGRRAPALKCCSSAYKERLPVPVINPGLLMYKLCEAFLELGRAHGKKAFPSPQVLKDEEIFSRLVAEK